MCEVDGKAIPKPGECHAVFTDKEMKISSAHDGTEEGTYEANVFGYRLYPTSEPKNCGLWLLRNRSNTTAIPGAASYRLEKNSLTFVRQMSPEADYPATFEPGKGRRTYLFSRAESIHTAPPKPLSKEETAALEGLRKDLTEAIGLLEAKKYRAFLDRFLTPEERNRQGDLEDTLEEMKELGPPFAKLLPILLTERPSFNASRTRVTYDLHGIHVNGLKGKSDLCCTKIDGKWFLENK